MGIERPLLDAKVVIIRLKSFQQPYLGTVIDGCGPWIMKRSAAC